MMNIIQRKPIISSKPNSVKEWFCNMRGIKKVDYDAFFFPTKDNMYSPFDLYAMDIVVFKTLDAIEKGKTICVYGDV